MKLMKLMKLASLRTIIVATVTGLLMAATAGGAASAAPRTVGADTPPASASTAPHRLVMYYQTQYFGGSGDADPGTYVSPLPLRHAGATAVIVGAFHLNDTGVDHLNDHPPAHPRYDQMWRDLGKLQKHGVDVIGMIGGAAPGSFTRLDTEFDTYYPRLRDYVRTYGLDGVDLDVEQPMSLAGIERVIDALRADFGPDFIITLAPVAPALRAGGNLSGFSYDQLYADRGDDIAWFNTQFYCGWGLLDTTTAYDRIIAHGVVPAAKVVAVTLTNPGNCGGSSGFVPMNQLRATIHAIHQSYPDFGGIGGWEYFNSTPAGLDRPWVWTRQVAKALR